MSRRGEQWFHLTISVFALSLTFASILAIEYQRSPNRVRSWLAPLQHISILSDLSGLQRSQSLQSSMNSQKLQHLHQQIPVIAGQHGQQTTGSQNQNETSGSSNAAAQPTKGQNSQFASKLIRVKAFNSNVPKSDVIHTQKLIKQYQIPQHIAAFLGFQLHSKATIILVNNSASYQQALQQVGVTKSETPHLSLDTGGFTIGTTVLIPLYQNKSTFQLINTVSHELTHVFLNTNGGSLPSWLNEGMAVHMGMMMQGKAEGTIAYGGYAKRMAENVIGAAGNKTLRPLTNNEQAVIKGGAPYDIELQDWLAVNMLLQDSGTTPFHKFLKLMHNGTSSKAAFVQAFGTTPADVNTVLTQLLQTASHSSDKGVVISLQIPSTYQGYLRILPHGSHNWDGISLFAGNQKLAAGSASNGSKGTGKAVDKQFTLLPNGDIKGYSGTVQHTYDARPVDNQTVYLNLDPTKAFTYQGQKVADAGIALDYHDGLYGFVNSWITLTNGKTVYINKPSLFGVQLKAVRDVSQTNPVLTLLQLPS